MIKNAEDINKRFFEKVERDDDFFSYYGIDEEEAMKLAHDRAYSYFKDAIAYLHRMMDFDFNLDYLELRETIIMPGGVSHETGNVSYTLKEGITGDEVDLIAQAMLLQYFERDLSKLKAKLNFLSSSDLTVLHSPANERTSFVQMLADIKEELMVAMTNYQSRDRLTGKRKSVNSSAYFEDSGE